MPRTSIWTRAINDSLCIDVFDIKGRGKNDVTRLG